MFQLTLLGTAASAPTVKRGLPALLVRHEGQSILVDCGEGTQRQIMASPVGFSGLQTVLLTHAHPDHILGFCGLVATLALWRAVPRMDVFAGADPIAAAQALLRVGWPRGRPPLDLRFHPVSPGPVLDTPKLRVSAFPVQHSARDSLGFRFEEPARVHLRPDRLTALGVPDGPERAALARGAAVTLPDGRRVTPEEVCGPACPGARLAVVGDVENVEDLVPHVADVDLLVIEATFLHADADKARQRSHITARQAAELAQAANVKFLCLTHISERYPPGAVAAEAGAIFSACHVAADFDQIAVKPGEVSVVGNAGGGELLQS